MAKVIASKERVNKPHHIVNGMYLNFRICLINKFTVTQLSSNFNDREK